MALSSIQKLKLEIMLNAGEDQMAIEYLQRELNMSMEEATLAVEKLKPAVKSSPAKPLQKQTSTLETFKETKIGSNIGMIFIGIGIIMIGIAGYIIFSDYQFIQHSVLVNGKVVDFNTHYSSNDDGVSTFMYSPVFEYEYNGQQYTHTNNYSSSSRGFEIGEEVEMYIKPDTPDSGLVNSFMERWFLVVLLGGLGIVFSGVGYLAVRLFN